jgi:hypothetical protein
MQNNVTSLPTSDVGVATDFVIKLVQFGFIGLAALLFVLCFLILWRNQQADAGMAKFRMAFLGVGFLSVVLSAGVQILPTRAKTSVTFSTDFAQAGLPTPPIRLLPGGKAVSADTEFTLPSSTSIFIQTGGLVANSKSLQSTTQQLAQATAKLATSEPASAPQAQQVTQLSTAVRQHVDGGDFAAAQRAATQLTALTRQISH